MKKYSNLYLVIILLLSLLNFIIGKNDEYIQIKEFEKIKVSLDNNFFQFQYIPKDNETIIYSGLVLSLERNLNEYYGSDFYICLFDYNPYKEQPGKKQCIRVNDSSSIYFDNSVITDIGTKYYIEFNIFYSGLNNEDEIAYAYDENFPSSFEFFGILFIFY